MPKVSQIRTLGALKASGYRPRPVKQELRDNLRERLTGGGPLFPGILGYDRTVIPAVINALLAGHDFILLGLRGQAKTRILRSLTTLLDPAIPVLAGSELNDDPLAPISVPGQRLVAEAGDDAPVDWLSPEQRYNEKLATPDVSIADLLGDIDPIKAATRKLTFADPEVIHFGIVPRTNRGIFAINELPDLSPRIQVGLFNILEERDLQIRGFPVRIPLDLLLVFSANPEDYTNRGSIITPLKDRISSQILTHYPPDATVAADITRQEAWTERGVASVVIPEEFRLMIEEISFAARESDLVDQSSGVSARVAISALELLASNLERRALALAGAPRTGTTPPATATATARAAGKAAAPPPAGAAAFSASASGSDADIAVYPRLVDLQMLLPAITGKVEMVYEGEQQGAEVVARRLIGQAVKKAFDRRFPEVGKELGSGGEDDKGPYAGIVRWFAEGNAVNLSDEQPFAEYEAEMRRVPGLADIANRYGGRSREERALAAELVLEGLHQHLKLARNDLDSQVSYKEMVKFQLLKPRGGSGRRGSGRGGDVN
ncbi:MAG TPA: magnesium chelatase [Thermoanaerobaculia bacterium]|nr:magnesium chelatase [Thermoanaerobaculia bacterium]